LAERFLNAPNFWTPIFQLTAKKRNVYFFTSVIRARETIPLLFLLPLQTELSHFKDILSLVIL